MVSTRPIQRIKNTWIEGIRVIPTVNWGDESTFDFYFDGIEKGSPVAVSTYPALEHGCCQGQKEWFMSGYNEMLQRIEPEKIICYNKPLSEMQGNLIYVDYESCSWRYLEYEQSLETEDLSVYKIGFTSSVNHDIIDYTIIGTDGLAIRERHHTSSPNPKYHSDPRDHIIDWGRGFPSFGDAITYFDGPAPEFKRFLGGLGITSTTFQNDFKEDRFLSVEEFKDCISRGGEVVFQWGQTEYGIGLIASPPHLAANGSPALQYCVAYADGSHEKLYDTPDDVLEYMVGKERIGDIITKAQITYRTI